MKTRRILIEPTYTIVSQLDFDIDVNFTGEFLDIGEITGAETLKALLFKARRSAVQIVIKRKPEEVAK